MRAHVVSSLSVTVFCAIFRLSGGHGLVSVTSDCRGRAWQKEGEEEVEREPATPIEIVVRPFENHVFHKENHVF